jgi:hypothetical protein
VHPQEVSTQLSTSIAESNATIVVSAMGTGGYDETYQSARIGQDHFVQKLTISVLYDNKQVKSSDN